MEVTEKKQTAVDWLFLMLNNPNNNQEFYLKLLKKAKEIEEQQIINSYIDGNYKSNMDIYWKKKSAKKYYIENYESNR